MTTLEEIYREWANNPKFREDFKKDPLQALEMAGFTVSTTDLDKIRALLKIDESSNESLDDRISK